MWKVFQRGARRLSAWRVVFQGREAKARRCYARRLARMCRGHLLLIDPAGKPVLCRWIPPRAEYQPNL
jgi:hypothetical protein